jgi:hypothetical protein
MQKTKRSRKDSVRDDTFGIRGTGVGWQASFGDPLSEADLLFSVRREPIANRVVFSVAHDVFDKGFTVEEIAEKPDPNWSREVSKVLDDLNAKAVFTQMLAFERLFGWAIIAISYVDHGKDVSQPVQGPQEIRELIPYSSLQATVQGSDEDKKRESSRFGLPNLYTLNRSGATQTKLHFSRAIHCATRLLDHPWKGMSVLECIYDDLTVWRNERWGLGQTLFRYGSGFPDVEVHGATKEKLDDLEDSQQFKNLCARTYFLHNEKTKFDFKGVAGRALNPEPYCVPIVESLSCGSGINTTILRGAQAGALEGSEVNERGYFKFISGIQTLVEPCVWELIDKLMETGQIRKVNDYRIVWPEGVEASEKDKAAVDLAEAQARDLKTGWMTVDEIRAEQKLDPLPGGAGSVVLGVKKSEQQPFQPGGQSPGPVSEGDESRFERFVSWLRGKKDENVQDKQD